MRRCLRPVPDVHPDAALAARDLLAAVYRDLDALARRAAWHCWAAKGSDEIFAELNLDRPESSEKWRSLAHSLLRVRSAVGRLCAAPELDPQLVRLRSDEIETIRARWCACDRERGLDELAADTDGLSAEDRADVEDQVGGREESFATIFANLHEVVVRLRPRRLSQ